MSNCGFEKNIHKTTNCASMTTIKPVVSTKSKEKIQKIITLVWQLESRGWGGGGGFECLSWRTSGRCQSVQRRGFKKGCAGVKGLTVSHMIWSPTGPVSTSTSIHQTPPTPPLQRPGMHGRNQPLGTAGTRREVTEWKSGTRAAIEKPEKKASEALKSIGPLVSPLCSFSFFTLPSSYPPPLFVIAHPPFHFFESPSQLSCGFCHTVSHSVRRTCHADIGLSHTSYKLSNADDRCPFSSICGKLNQFPSESVLAPPLNLHL